MTELEGNTDVKKASVHPLESEWTFYYQENNPEKDWKENIHPVASFSTIEEFCHVFSFLKKPSDLPCPGSISVFRNLGKHHPHPSMPLWESFPDGGRWFLRLRKSENGNSANWAFEQLIIAAITEAFEDPVVVGVECCLRKNENILAVWMSDASNFTTRFSISNAMKKFLKLNPGILMEFKTNTASINTGSFHKSNVFTT